MRPLLTFTDILLQYLAMDVENIQANLYQLEPKVARAYRKYILSIKRLRRNTFGKVELNEIYYFNYTISLSTMTNSLNLLMCGA